MKILIQCWILRLEASMHLVDAYLATARGDTLFAADAECRAWECERRIDILRVQL